MSNNKTQILAEKGRHEILITREFEAPPDLVYRAFSEPAHFMQWNKPGQAILQVEKMDCRSGGSFQWHQVHADGKKFSFYGVYHEVIPEKQIIKTSEFRGLPQKLLPVLEITGFESLPDGQTKLTIRIICPDEVYRDGMVNAGMQEHFEHAFSLLDKLFTEALIN